VQPGYWQANGFDDEENMSDCLMEILTEFDRSFLFLEMFWGRNHPTGTEGVVTASHPGGLSQSQRATRVIRHDFFKSSMQESLHDEHLEVVCDGFSEHLVPSSSTILAIDTWDPSSSHIPK
jgi:hypothetical protein